MASTTLPPTSLVEPADFAATGRGLRCKRDVAAGEELLVVPLDACWHAADARKNAEVAALTDAGAELTDFDASVVQLLAERAKGDSSSRRAHLRELPAAYDSTLFWSDSELQELEGSNWLGLADRFAEEVAADWAALCARAGVEDFMARHGVVYEDYKWAYATLKSRAVEACVGGVPGVRLMAPGFDLFNHSDALTPGTSHLYDEDRQCLIAVASHAHAAGEQAFISYGAASNGSLLLAGGFVMPSNRFDAVEVCLTSEVDAARLNTYMMAAPDAPGSLAERAPFEFLAVPDDESIAAAGGHSPFTTRHLLTMQSPLPSSLLAYVRLDRLGVDDFAVHEKRLQKESPPRALWEAVRSDALAPVDALVELLSLGALRGVLVAMLRAYPTTLREDERLLLAVGKAVYVPGRSSGDRALGTISEESPAGAAGGGGGGVGGGVGDGADGGAGGEGAGAGAGAGEGAGS